MVEMADISEEELQALYAWIDEIPLSRPKKNIGRDFSDAVLAAEVVGHFLPRLVELHNYSPANSTSQKLDNWRTLNRKVFSRLNLNLPDDILQSVAASKPGVIEFILNTLRTKIEKFLQFRTRETARRELSEDNDHYRGLYDPEELPSSYGTATQMVYNPQEHLRHPGPAHHTHTGGGIYHHQQHVPAQSRIPLPVHRHLSQPDQTNSLSDPLLLPPLNPRHNPRLPNRTEVVRRHSNPEKRPKLPNVERRNVYAGNPRAKVLSNNPQQRESSAGIKIRMAEREQKILESHELIQLLQMKVTRLEHLVQIKDMKISELTRQLEMTRHPLQKR